MAQRKVDGYFDVEFNADRTQAFATVYPPKAGGAPVTAKAIIDKLRDRGVVYGFREPDIITAAKLADESQTIATKVLVAQGVLPEDGKDAQVLWKVDFDAIAEPIPYRPEGQIDYFALNDHRLVKAGQLLAVIVPAKPGTPGKTITAPLQEVRQNAGKDVTLTAGPGVRLSDDRCQFFAVCDGFAELRRDKLTVYDVTRVEGDLDGGFHTFSGSVVIAGGVKGSRIHAEGVIAIRGVAANAQIRTHGDVMLTQAMKSTILTEGNIYVTGALLHCEVNTKQKLIGQEGAKVAGGMLVASEGVRTTDLGAVDSTPTQIIVGRDYLSKYRLEELEKEIITCELNVQKISQALRPLNVVSSEPLPEQKKSLVQRLADQRRSLEARIRDLMNERRTLSNYAKSRMEGDVAVSGTVYPGVGIVIQDAEIVLEQPQQGVRIAKTSDGAFIHIQPLSKAKAA